MTRLTKYLRLQLFTPKATYPEGESNRVLILEPKEIPTTFFYVRSRIPEVLGGSKTRRFDSEGAPPKSLKIEPGTWVIIVRHVSRRWLRVLLANKDSLVRVTYVSDDDIPSVMTASELPLYYSLWTWWRYFKIKNLLGEVVSEIMVSTTELATRYPNSHPTVWEPHYNEGAPYKPDPQVYFYHATVTHFREMKWLVPIVRRVQKAMPDAWFEIIGDSSAAQLFRGIPRVRCIHPMSWPTYQAYVESVRYQVGLAPLLDTPFNRARSHTKLYQITKAGAAGIYSDVVPYSEKIVDGVNGMLCANFRYLWVRTIIELLKNPLKRKAIHGSARNWCDELQKATS